MTWQISSSGSAPPSCSSRDRRVSNASSHLRCTKGVRRLRGFSALHKIASSSARKYMGRHASPTQPCSVSSSSRSTRACVGACGCVQRTDTCSRSERVGDETAATSEATAEPRAGALACEAFATGEHGACGSSHLRCRFVASSSASTAESEAPSTSAFATLVTYLHSGFLVGEDCTSREAACARVVSMPLPKAVSRSLVRVGSTGCDAPPGEEVKPTRRC
mmetsp:Transcript_3539/g.7377  ORF Transcript_3539/g.7377 Transcript_3539/m.7377 type:complete len:220 (-) Transcript_3539:1122-1781(-)